MHTPVEGARGIPRTRRHIAVLVPSMGGGGAERVVVNLLRGFIRVGLDVDLLLVRPRGPLLGEIPAGVRVVPLRGGRIIASVPSIVGYLRRERPDALLSHLDTMNVAVILARRIAGVPSRLVVTTHVALVRHAASGSFRGRIVPWLVARLYPLADAVIGVSHGVGRELEERVGADRVKANVIHNPIVSTDLEERARDLIGGSPPSLPGVPGDARLILSVGRLHHQKNQALLVEAFARLADEIPDLHLAILGEGPERAALEALVEERGLTRRVSLPGFAGDPAPWYAAASVFVLPSNWEGLPSVLIEALLFGCPVVSTRCPSGPDEILEGGRYGRLVPMDDPVAMAEAIRETLDAPPDPAPLRRRALDFGFDSSVRAYLDVLLPEDGR